MSENKFYLLYSDQKQTKFRSMARNLEVLKGETEYWSDGVWFEYNTKEGSNLLSNEKEMTDILFPKEPKQRHLSEIGGQPKVKFKWVS